MRINHNMMAINTHRQLGVSTNAGAKSMEKLSSGYRINRAGDDAAGLSISEKMRNQVRGLERASANSQDGISLIQTAEGALDETHAILKRMRELTVQAGNEGTLQEEDMNAIKDEYDELTKELDGIADRTEFNGKKLLDGSYKGQLQIGANQDQAMNLDINTEVKVGLGTEKIEKFEIKKDPDKVEVKAQFDLKSEGYDKIAITGTGADGETSVKVETSIEDGKEISSIEINIGEDTKTPEELKALLAEHGISYDIKLQEGEEFAEGQKDLFDTTVKDMKVVTIAGHLTAAANALKVETKGGGTSSEDLGVHNLEFKLDSEDQALQVNSNLEKVDGAIRTVSKLRSHLGANQNRLEHTIKNLDNAAENIQASESRIRDVDMAKEMMEQTRQNILQQASTSMLAQANMAPQTVLQLLG